MPPKKKTGAEPVTHELVLTRTIDAPRDLVWEAWTKQLAEWWGPHGMTTPVVEMELKPGGRFHTVMRDPDGNEYPNTGVFLEVKKPERIVFTDAFGDGWKPSGRAFMTAIITLEEKGAKTKYAARALHWSAADREEHEKMGFHQGWGESLDRFEAVVAKLKKGAVK